LSLGGGFTPGHGIAVASPGETVAALAGLLAQPAFWVDDLAVSVRRVGLGFFLGLAAGGGLGLLAGWHPAARAFLTPSRWILTSVPGVVTVMLGMLWFGLGSAMVVAIVALMVAPAIHVAVIEGLSAVDAALAEMARAYRFPPGMRLWTFTPRPWPRRSFPARGGPGHGHEGGCHGRDPGVERGRRPCPGRARTEIWTRRNCTPWRS
jgi:ABC-type nitrate/sulfonate/bicarbonate transport system permease component